MKKIFVKGLLFVCLSFSFSLHSANNPADFQQTIVNRFSKFIDNYPQEKLYLHIDKPYYSAGETLWFKGYLVNASTIEPKSLSGFIYVELISKSDSVFYRAKIKQDSLGFAGSLNLKPDLPSGFYTLRAYTYWMQNATSDFFFNKVIYIGNTIDDATQSQIKYGSPINDNIPITVKLTNARKNPLTNLKVDIEQFSSKKSTKLQRLTTNTLGEITWLQPLDTIANSKKSFNLATNNSELKFKKTFYLPDFSNNFDVQFFPESGILLDNNLQTIAFKAIGENGLSVEVSGKVFNNKDQEIIEFSSLNKGMGKLAFTTQPNETYYAKIKLASGLEKRFELPKTQISGVSIHFSFNKENILYEIFNQTNTPNNNLHLVIQSRGKVLLINQINSLSGKISNVNLPSGILTFSVIDTVGNTLCERLCFVKHANLPTITMQSDKQIYDKRDSVNLNFNIKSLLGKTNVGNLSISVTDSRTISLDSLGDNIMTNLLLTSDLKGNIEDPAMYFADNLNSTREKLDLLMLTQGWRRFKTADIIKGTYQKPKYYIESGQFLSGKVKNILNKPSKSCMVIALIPNSNSVKMTETDNQGNFIIDHIQFPDSTTLILKAKKEKGFGDVELIVDKDEFPEASTFIPYKSDSTNIIPTEYLQQSKEKYYSEGGMRVVNLAEVTVKATKINKEESREFYTGAEDSKMSAEEMDKFPGISVKELLMMMPGVRVEDDEVYFRINESPAMIMIDNIEVQSGSQEITFLTSDDVEKISIFKGANTILFGSKGANGVVTIELKKAGSKKTVSPLSLTRVTPLGFQKPSEFYVPKYNVDSIKLLPKADLRTTIYWNPKLTTDDAGNVNVKFFTADNPSKYSVIVEGVTKDGEICRYLGYLKRE